MQADDLREGIFNLNTRRFGTVAEVMIKRLAALGKSRNMFHDLYDDIAKHRVEVKFSTVRKKSARPITEATVLSCIKDEMAEIREVKFADWKTVKFDCNIQQIKRDQFEVLYYGLFFHDQVVIFRIASSDIGDAIGYCDRQHKGNVGEGQFHISEKTLAHHLKKHLYKKMDYADLLVLLT